MMGKKVGAQQRPTIQGLMLQNSSYGKVIPRTLGMTKGALNTIWANGLREGDSGKKGKKAGKKGAPPTYVCNIDFLLGSNPLVATLRWWVNATPASNNAYALNFVSHQFSIPSGAIVPMGIVTSGSPPSNFILDPNFYCIIGVTAVIIGYEYDFNDYGGNGPQTVTGNFEMPLWNASYSGPDPVDDYGWRKSPLIYYNQPFSGTIDLFADSIRLPSPPAHFGVGASYIKIYYAQLINGKVPIAQLRMAFEAKLGSGSEYIGYTSQQIQYPQYAGCGSSDIDLGSGPAVPNLKPEILGAYPYYYTGDCDFADMIEDICKMGQSQAAIGDTAYQLIHYGASLSEYPGAIQKMNVSGLEGFSVANLTYPRPNTAKNILIATFSNGTGIPAIQDSAGNTWVNVLGPTAGYQVAYVASCVAANNNLVTWHAGGYGSPGWNDWDGEIYEFADLDTIDSTQVVAATQPGGIDSVVEFDITTTNFEGSPSYIFIYHRVSPGNTQGVVQQSNFWKPLISNTDNYYNQFSYPAWTSSYYRIVWSPGTYKFRLAITGGTTYQVAIVVMKNSNPPAFPKPLGNILDKATLEQCRQQCQANGLFGSLYMDSQRKASEWMNEIYEAMNAWPVYSGFKLKSIARSEVSIAGNGTGYIAATASGPVANLVPGDHIGSTDMPVISIKRKAVSDSENLIQIQHPDRSNQYNPTITSQPNNGAIALRGTKKKSPQSMPCVQNTSVARALLGIAVRRQSTLLNEYSGKLRANNGLLEAGDLVTLTDPLVGINQLPVRLTKVAEDEKFNLDYTAEDFMYGLNAPIPLDGTPASPNTIDTTTVPAAVNTPIIFEPPQALSLDAQNEIWFVVSDADPVYGGCVVYVSIDGGSSYDPIGMIKGNSATGSITADWPQAMDPDTTNDLSVDLTESLETLTSYSVAQEDSLSFPCYVEVPNPKLIQSAAVNGPASAAFPGNLTAGNCVVVIAQSSHAPGSPDTISATDTLGNTFVNIQSDTRTGSSVSVAVLVAYNVLGGADTVTCASSVGGSFDHIIIMEFANVATASAFDVGNVVDSGIPFGGATLTAGPVTTTQARELMIGWAGGSGGGLNQQSGVAWNLIQNGGQMGAWYQDVGVTGNYNFTANVTTGVNQFYTGIVTLKGYTTALLSYELMAYAVANLTSANHYTLKATGGGNKLRRAIYGTWLDNNNPNVGPDHLLGSRFAFLNPTGAGILKMVTPTAWIGKNLLFKFVQFNTFFSGYGDLSTVTSYAYSTLGGANSGGGGGVGGGGGNTSYTITPSPALSQPSSTQINMAQCQAVFTPSGLRTNYNARTFTIADPGGTPTLYYVTIYDPTLAGDSGTSTNLTAYCATTQAAAHWNDPGYIRIGTIQAIHGGGGIGGGGGSSPQLTIYVNGVAIV